MSLMPRRISSPEFRHYYVNCMHQISILGLEPIICALSIDRYSLYELKKKKNCTQSIKLHPLLLSFLHELFIV